MLYIAVCIPSRGMLHSRFMDDLQRAVNYVQDERYPMQVRFEYFFSHGRPQPEAENYITRQALDTVPGYILYLDDDMQLPQSVIEDALQCIEFENSRAVVAHYPCSRNGNDAVHIRDGKFESAGMGFVLIKPEALLKLEEPYFRCDTQWIWNGERLEPSPVPPNHTPESIHGMHDVDFMQRLLRSGTEPSILATECGQYNLLTSTIHKYGNYTQQEVETWRL